MIRGTVIAAEWPKVSCSQVPRLLRQTEVNEFPGESPTELRRTLLEDVDTSDLDRARWPNNLGGLARARRIRLHEFRSFLEREIARTVLLGQRALDSNALPADGAR